VSAQIGLTASLAYESLLFGIAWFGRNSRDSGSQLDLFE
jgi:hypothetical protein